MAQRKIFIAGKNFVGEKSDSSAARIGVHAAGSPREGTKFLRKDEPPSLLLLYVFAVP